MKSGITKKPATTLSSRSIANSLLKSADEMIGADESTKDRLKTHQWKKAFTELPDAVQQEYKCKQDEENGNGE